MTDKIIDGVDISKCPNIQKTVNGRWLCYREGRILSNWFSCEGFKNCPYKTMTKQLQCENEENLNNKQTVESAENKQLN